MTTGIWNIELLGRLTARRDGRRITRFGTEKAGLLLACLAQEPGRAYWRDELATDLWPDNSVPSARNCLRIALCFLRDQLEHKPAERGNIIVADRAQIYLNPAAFITDKAIFESNLAEAANAPDNQTRIQCLERAVECYRSGLLPDFNAAWISTERHRLADAYLLALRRLVRAHIDLRQYPEALAVARRAVMADPSREESHRLLMDVYAHVGQPSAALRQYQHMQEAMAREPVTRIAAEPAPTPEHERSSRELATQDADVTEANEANAEHVSPVSRLIGRRQAAQQVCEMLDTPETRLVTVTGPSGIGKSRLAAAVRSRLQTERVWLVPLESLTEPHFLVSTIAAAVGAEETGRTSLRETLREALATGPATVILDGIDGLLPEAGETISSLLDANPTLKLLVTCRSRLQMPGEYEYAVRPLPIPTVRDRDELVTVASCRLWLDRAMAVRPHFRPTPPKAKAILALCRRVDGVPMAIELTAGWAGTLTPAQILLDFLDYAGRVPVRQPLSFAEGTTRIVIDWSVNRLTPIMRQFLARLSVFRGGFTLEAAESVCQQRNALEHLDHLIELSLVSKVDAADATRFSLPESVREYAAGILTETEQKTVRERHKGYFMSLAATGEPHAVGPEAAAWLLRLGHEVHNFRAALRYCLESGKHDGDALELSCSLFWFWYARGEREECQHWILASLADSRSTPDSLRDKALAALENLAFVSQP